MNKQLAYITYYAIAATIVASQVAFTLYQTSLTISHGRTLKHLEVEKAQLATQQQKLQTTVASTLSLTQFTQDQTAEYQLIAAPILVSATDNLAAAQ